MSINSYSEILFEKKVIFDKSSISDFYKINDIKIVTQNSYTSEDYITYSSTKINVVEDKVLLISQLINLHKDSLYYRK